MSFEKLSEADIKTAAAMFGVDLDSSMNQKGRVSPKLAAAAFAEEGVTFDMYTELAAKQEQARQEAEAAEAEQAALEEQRLAAAIKSTHEMEEEDVEPEADFVPAPKRRKRPASTDILVKMDRQNSYYEVRGKIFSREHPFVLMSEDEAQAIFDTEWGFRVATPREAAEYYS